jgi:hypothetical protein
VERGTSWNVVKSFLKDLCVHGFSSFFPFFFHLDFPDFSCLFIYVCMCFWIFPDSLCAQAVLGEGEVEEAPLLQIRPLDGQIGG